jgi:hypothetical protein
LPSVRTRRDEVGAYRGFLLYLSVSILCMVSQGVQDGGGQCARMRCYRPRSAELGDMVFSAQRSLALGTIDPELFPFCRELLWTVVGTCISIHLASRCSIKPWAGASEQTGPVAAASPVIIKMSRARVVGAIDASGHDSVVHSGNMAPNSKSVQRSSPDVCAWIPSSSGCIPSRTGP